MLQQGSLKSSSSSSSHDQVHEEEDQGYPSTSYHHQQQEMQINNNILQYSSSSSSSITSMPRLLISCAQLFSQSHLDAAHRLNGVLSRNSSPHGDSTERLVHQFSRALSLRIMRSPATMASSFIISGSSKLDVEDHHQQYSSSSSLESSYFSLNQITPFIRFSHLTANQAILEAVEQETYQQAVHILDFDIMHGLQWPPFMQALAERYSSGHRPLPMLRVTATGHDLTVLNRTGDRLSKFAQSLGLRFQFHPLLVLNEDDLTASLAHLIILPNEALAINCVLYIHRLLKDDDNQLMVFLRRIKALNPKVVTIAEREGNHNHPLFLQRFEESLEHYAAIFDSLEATLPPNSRERLGVEQIWFGREIMDIVAGEGEERRERHQRFESWEMMLKASGFENIPLSPFALSQAKLLLRLHYPSEGYQLQIRNNSFFLGWQNRPLFSVSSWR